MARRQGIAARGGRDYEDSDISDAELHNVYFPPFKAAIDAGAVEAINAHGTGTQANDSTETAAIKAVFGARAQRIPISATKALHGHLLGAAGALECVLSLLAMRNEVALPTMHLQTPDPECDLDYVPNQARTGVAARTMLSNSFAFGGTNAVLVLRAAH